MRSESATNVVRVSDCLQLYAFSIDGKSILSLAWSNFWFVSFLLHLTHIMNTSLHKSVQVPYFQDGNNSSCHEQQQVCAVAEEASKKLGFDCCWCSDNLCGRVLDNPAAAHNEDTLLL